MISLCADKLTRERKDFKGERVKGILKMKGILKVKSG